MAGAPKEELVLDGTSTCDRVREGEKRAIDSKDGKKEVEAEITRPFSFRIRCPSVEQRTKLPPRTRVSFSPVLRDRVLICFQYFSGESAEERDAWVLAISNNIQLMQRPAAYALPFSVSHHFV
jgi:hypothetical protein